jgi:hypothetical protein
MVAVEAKESKRAHPTPGWIDSSEQLREFGEGLIIDNDPSATGCPVSDAGNQIVLFFKRDV